MIRIKETSEIKNSDSSNTIYYIPDSQYHNLNKVIVKVIKYIGNYNLSINVSRDRTEILQSYIQSKKERSLENTHSEIAKEWHPILNGKLKPSNFSYGTQKIVWWLCPKEHSYQSSIVHRVEGNGCPYCAGKKVLKGFNDLATLNPDLSKEWNNRLNNKQPTEVTKGSSKKYWWTCSKCGYEYQASIKHRMHGTGCPLCANKVIIAGKNDLQTLNPKLAKEWHPYKNSPLLPTQVSRASGKKVWWLCHKCKNEWQTTIHKRSSGSGCPICNKLKRKK